LTTNKNRYGTIDGASGGSTLCVLKRHHSLVSISWDNASRLSRFMEGRPTLKKLF
jgi:hypothetical protein